ncbi:hypothetical protein BC941DRAFT_426016 [Chlamydoabsidia padenii]|nr:hypothetical protein BC941DRAFT_426016 [Chlamydoabsidia padenii]
MLSTHPCTVHEQLLASFIQLRLLEPIPTTSYYRIVNTQVSGVFTPVASCYSSTCDYRRPCYSPCCPLQKAQSDLFTSTNTWLQRIPKHILQKTHRNELLRQAAITDLLSMEQSYLADLHVLDEIYSKPLLLSTCISNAYRDSFHKLLFGNYRLISKLHQRFCFCLIKHCQKPNQCLFGKVGQVIYQHVQTLIDPYIQYTGNHIRSSYALRLERHRNPSFCRFVDTQNAQPRTRRLSLDHFLSAPTLWIGKYRMLVEALAKRSDSTSEDKVILQQCVVMLQNLLSQMNQAVTNAGHDTRRAHVTACLSNSVSSSSVDTIFGWAQQWMFPNDTKLIREGKMWLQRSTLSHLPTTPTTTTATQCHLFLFDHMLFVTTAKLVDGLEEYSIAGRPIPLAAFVWLDGEQYNHDNSSSPFIHRFSRQLSSRLSAKSSTIWSSLRRTPSTTFQPPILINSLSSSQSTPITSPPASLPSTFQSLGSASRLKRRLRTNRWSSSPVYTPSTSSAIQSSSLSVLEQPLNRRQSVPELSFSSINHEVADHTKTNNYNKPRHQKVNLSPLTPIISNINKKRASSTFSSTTSTSSSSILELPEILHSASTSPTPDTQPPSSIELEDRKQRYLQFCHAGSMETPFTLEFDDTHECREWRDTINTALLRVKSPFILSPIWEQSNITLKRMAPTQQQDESTCKKMSSAPWASISTSTSLSTINVTPRQKSDPDEDLQHMQIHCALSYETDCGKKMLALGTQDGVWIGTRHYFDSLEDRLTQGNLQQIIPAQACHRLALINGMLVAMAYNSKHKYSLVAYPLLNRQNENPGETTIQQGRKSKDMLRSPKRSWYVVKRDWVISMAVGRLYQQVVMAYLTRYGNHILAVVAIPKSQPPFFKKVKEYTVRLKEANSISIYENTLYIQSNKYGVESITPSRKRETSVHWQQIYHSPCIDYIPLSSERGLAVTLSGVRPVDLTDSSSTSDRHGSTTQKYSGMFDFESRIFSISVDYPYMIAYGPSLVEIWNIEMTELVQVIHSSCIRRLYDSRQYFIDDSRKPNDRNLLMGIISNNSFFRIHQLKQANKENVSGSPVPSKVELPPL